MVWLSFDSIILVRVRKCPCEARDGYIHTLSAHNEDETHTSESYEGCTVHDAHWDQTFNLWDGRNWEAPSFFLLSATLSSPLPKNPLRGPSDDWRASGQWQSPSFIFHAGQCNTKRRWGMRRSKEWIRKDTCGRKGRDRKTRTYIERVKEENARRESKANDTKRDVWKKKIN